MDFNKLNTELYQLSAPHRFSKKPTELDKGYLKIADWLGDVCFHFEQKRKNQEKSDEEEFKALIDDYRDKINELDNSEYKKGLLKALREAQ